VSQLIDLLVEKFHEHWTGLVKGAILLAAGWLFGRFRSYRAWQRREFLDRVNVSLNILRDGKLQIRTLMEKRCADVFLNDSVAKGVMKAAKKTTAQDSILPLPTADLWYYLNPVLNEISEQFAAGSIRKDAGLPVVSLKYVLCLTCEQAADLRQKKIRVMVIREDVLTALPAEQPQLESPRHSTRWTTLNQLAAVYAKTPERFLVMEIAV
jgi:hypothetical protein